MHKFVLKDVESKYIPEELSKIGFDESYRYKASEKFDYKNIKIFSLTPAQANIIKQTAISCGADCATHREVITGHIEKSDVILGGSISELKKISDKLKYQPFDLNILADKILNSLNVKKGKIVKLAGILNITPDSFSDGGKYLNPKDAQNQLLKLIEDGADIIDIGAESTRPYSQPVSSEEQIFRLKPILEFIQKENLQIPISIDTRSSETADFALNNGAAIINDVSGFDYDIKMPSIIAKYKAGVIIQHSKGTPENMQDSPSYNNMMDEIYKSLYEKTQLALSLGINNIIVDPGFGFGKTKEDNFILLERISEFFTLGYPVMAGISRKSFLGLENDDNGMKDIVTAAFSTPLIKTGIDYLRVHNVKLHKKIIQLA